MYVGFICSPPGNTMKMGRLIAALVVLAALGGTLYWSNHRKPQESTSAAASTSIKIISLKQEDVQNLEIKKRDGDDVVLARVAPEEWKITSPKPLIADHQLVSSMLFD